MRPIALVLAGLLGGCVPQAVERDLPSMCRLARDVPVNDISLSDLTQLTAPFPRAHHYASQAYELRNATWIMTAFGAAGLVGAFVTGFAADTSRNETRAALGGTIGVTIALGLGATIAGAYSGKSRHKAVLELRDEVNNLCPQVESVPVPAPPPPPEVPSPPAPLASPL